MEKLNILIIEDEGLIAINTQILLEDMGHHVMAVAHTGKSALEAAEEEVPDLALVDIKLKGSMSGIETARELNGRLNVPVLYITGNTDRKTLDEALSINNLGLLQKPFDDIELEEAIISAASQIDKKH